MAAAIKQASGIDAELIQSKGGVFDVEVDGTVIYSKHKTMRFPTHAEILDKLSCQTKRHMASEPLRLQQIETPDLTPQTEPKPRR